MHNVNAYKRGGFGGVADECLSHSSNAEVLFLEMPIVAVSLIMVI